MERERDPSEDKQREVFGFFFLFLLFATVVPDAEMQVSLRECDENGAKLWPSVIIIMHVETKAPASPRDEGAYAVSAGK